MGQDVAPNATEASNLYESIDLSQASDSDEETDNERNEDEDEERKKQIHGLLCVVFDNEKGPVIKAADPVNCLAKSFQPLGPFLCPDQALAGRSLSLTVESFDIHGLPIYIPSETYDRSCFRFCIAVIVECNRRTRMLALQLAQTFYNLEMDRRFVSSASKEQLENTLRMVRQGINNNDGVVEVPFSEVDAPLRFKERFYQRPPPKVLFSDVPLPLVDLEKCQHFSWDYCLRQIIPYINGLHSIHSIAKQSNIDEECIIEIIQHLLLFKLVTIIDMVQRHNHYRLTHKFKDIWKIRHIRESAGEYVTGFRGNADLTVVQELYTQIRGVDMLDQFLRKKQEVFDTHNISPRHFITFGVMHGFLRRLHIYPVVGRGTSFSMGAQGDYLGGERPTDHKELSVDESLALRVLSICDGTRSIDSIQAEFDLSYEKVQNCFKTCPVSLKFMVRR